MKPSQTTVYALAAIALLPHSLAGNWPNHRGPAYNGSNDTEEALPATFSPTENVRWKTALPGPSSATPAIWGNRVFLTAAVKETETLKALCLDAKSGKTLWEKDIAKGFRIDDRSNLASPSPATDGKHVVFFFGTGDLATFDMDGKELWNKNLIGSDDYYFSFLWSFSTSPLIHRDQVVMQVLQRDESFNQFNLQRGEPGKKDNPSYLISFDITTGKELWRKIRATRAVAESQEAFSTPAPATADGKEMLIVSGGDVLTAHDPYSGKEIWRWGTWNPKRIGHWRLVPSPVTGGGVALVCAPKKSPVYAVDLKTGKLAWQSEASEISSDVCTPLFYRKHFYVLNGERKQKYLSCVDPATGKILWTGDIGAKTKIECSPSAGDGKIYFLDHNGTVYVVAADPKKFTVLHRVEFGSRNIKNLRSTIAIAGGDLFVRTHDTLYCIGQ